VLWKWQQRHSREQKLLGEIDWQAAAETVVEGSEDWQMGNAGVEAERRRMDREQRRRQRLERQRGCGRQDQATGG